MQRANGQWLVWLCMIIAGVLSLLPMPAILADGRPAWVAMIVLYWIMVLPQRYGLLFAWIVGLLMDVMMGVVLGQNAIALLIVAMAGQELHRRLKMYPLLQQSLIVLIIIGLYQLTILWISSAVGRIQPSLIYLLPAVTSAVFWPWLSSLLHMLRRRFAVY